MTRNISYPVYDADNHMYETREALTKYLPQEFKGRVNYVEVDGRTKIMFNNKISEMIPNPTFSRVARPGSAEDYFLGLNPEGKSFREFVGQAMDVIPAYQAPAPRLELMNEQGITGAVMYPTLASLVEERTTDDVYLTHAIIHALNEWMHEHWTFDYEGRIFATPVVNLSIVDKAIEELHWCLERGARTFLVRPAAVPGINGKSRSLGLPEFDPFWSEVVKAGVPVTFHASDSGYANHLAAWEGGDEQLPFAISGLREVVIGHRAIEDTLSALICHGALSRFPDLKVICVENGSSWVKGLLAQLKKAYGMMPQTFLEEPVSVFQRQLYIHPFLEDDIHEILDIMGEDHVLFGSDFPHPEGVGDPVTFADRIADLPPATVEKIMGGNLAGLLGVRATV
ncbi:amidohydrolase family protein [Mycolicibacterium pyrenivorans]|uniref:amidohydrolase family protein n=1 Tax=Mycolicibacterium pyrenivorans TaxID=187102 RepID=UPI0021F37FFB|nr:amidohydrolase [Mycolicibacterium pyrenivorans]MCV7153330.1 amidohydrolase family protein [Mycolicibacterium pyrenivorans]